MISSNAIIKWSDVKNGYMHISYFNESFWHESLCEMAKDWSWIGSMHLINVCVLLTWILKVPLSFIA